MTTLPKIGQGKASTSGVAFSINALADQNVVPKERRGVVMYTLRGLTDRPTANVGVRADSAPLVNNSQGKSVDADGAQRKPPHAANSEALSKQLSHFLKASPSKGIGRWRQSMEADLESYSSVSTWANVIYRKVEVETRNFDRPNPVRTAVCSLLLARMAPLCSPYGDLMTDLVAELLGSIYIDWGDFAANPGAQMEALDDGKQHPFDEIPLPAAVEKAPIEGKSRVPSFAAIQHRQTFFQLYRHLQNSRVQVIGRPAKVLGRAIDTWRRKVLSMVFHCWRGTISAARRIRARVENRTKERNVSRKAEIVENHFRAWRKYVFERRHQNRVVYEEKSRVTLIRRMGRRIQELEKDNARLTELYDHLVGQQREVGKRLRQMDEAWLKWKEEVHAIGAEKTSTDVVASASQALGKAIAAVSQAHKEGTSPLKGSLKGSGAGGGAEAIGFGGPAPGEEPEEVELGDHLRQEAAEYNNKAILELGYDILAKRPEHPLDPATERTLRQEISTNINQSKALPNRMGQLKDYLIGAGPPVEGERGSPVPEQATKPNEGKKRRDRQVVVHTEPTAAEVIQAHTGQPSHSGSPGSSPTSSPPPQGAHEHEAKASYKEVLEWVSLRVQLLVSGEVVMKRCTNFTTDFKDSVRFAYLFVSLGADKGIFDDVFTAKSMLQRAQVICAAIPSLVPEAHPYWVTPLEPQDIVKAKGKKISSLLFALFEQYKKLPLMLPQHDAPVNPRLDRKASSFHHEFTALKQELEGPRIPDSQFVHWYSELAAIDSDVDLEDDEVESATKARKSVVELAASRISERLNKHTFPGQAAGQHRHAAKVQENSASDLLGALKKEQQGGQPVPAMDASMFNLEASALSLRSAATGSPNSRTHRKSLAFSPSGKEREREREKESGKVGGWIAEKLALLNHGQVPNFEKFDNIQLLESVIQAVAPTSLQAASDSELQRLTVLQRNLADRFHLRKLRVRCADKVSPDEKNVITLKQLLTALYVIDNEGIVAV